MTRTYPPIPQGHISLNTQEQCPVAWFIYFALVSFFLILLFIFHTHFSWTKMTKIFLEIWWTNLMQSAWVYAIATTRGPFSPILFCTRGRGWQDMSECRKDKNTNPRRKHILQFVMRFRVSINHSFLSANKCIFWEMGCNWKPKGTTLPYSSCCNQFIWVQQIHDSDS